MNQTEPTGPQCGCCFCRYQRNQPGRECDERLGFAICLTCKAKLEHPKTQAEAGKTLEEQIRDIWNGCAEEEGVRRLAALARSTPPPRE